MDSTGGQKKDGLAYARMSAVDGTTHARRITRIYFRLRSVLLTVMACIGVLSLLLFIGATAFGLRPMVVISASMEPTVGVGSLILSVETPADSLLVGDVITVRAGDTKHMVTHRIVESGECRQGRCSFILKGDANIARDPHQVSIESAPRMWLVLPRVGYVIVWMRTWPGLITVALTLVSLLLLVVIVPRTGTRQG
ncbi:signal peptidase I [Bifidobacterium psychraerophilum]|jgi:signal peptidase|uniref:Signal peptidase I n=1 Tax=Bifidobacterium psychraerophilum TaxID=218140 RepID=A0A087CG73_9BIFI|nr:signal peptidase I [Bifidobacterium psychraerophilum]KFI82273.1 deoxyribodipyrimidine photo-lyase [Bifidobacterium psychraerophilum]PKA95078.1 signal peptidase [Bifidobacterium psychraerophilum DSM 22366]